MQNNLFRTGLVLLAGIVLALSMASAASITYSYDENGRLTMVDYGGGRTVRYVYDPANNTVQEVASSPDNTLLVAVSPPAAGTVSGNGIACPGDCSEAFSGTPTVSLTAAPAGGFLLLGWAGDLSGTANPVSLAMTTDRNAGCYFGAASGNTDTDGLPDSIEMGPNGNDPAYDGNHDGIPDYQQSNVASLPANGGGGGGNWPQGIAYATLAVPPPLTLSGVSVVGNPSPSDSPPGASFPFGFFVFTVEGLDPAACTIVDLYLPPSNLLSYFNHGPTPDDQDPHWYEFVHYHPALPGAEIRPGDAYQQVRLFLCDGQTGDHVMGEDGKIVGLGGPSGSLIAGIAVDPTSLLFDEIPAGTSAELTVTVSSTGEDDLVIGSVASSDPLDDPFSIVSDDCSGLTLPEGSSCRIVVRFGPAAAGSFTDHFDIPSNDGANPSVRVAVSGSASEARPIPTLGKTGLMILAILLVALGADIIRRRSL